MNHHCPLLCSPAAWVCSLQQKEEGGEGPTCWPESPAHRHFTLLEQPGLCFLDCQVPSPHLFGGWSVNSRMPGFVSFPGIPAPSAGPSTWQVSGKGRAKQRAEQWQAAERRRSGGQVHTGASSA